MTSVILTVNITSQLCQVTKHLSIQWKRVARRLENPGGRGRKASLPLLLPLEARETEEGGTEIAVGAHQDVVAWGGPPRHGRGGPSPTSRGGANGNCSFSTRLALLHKIVILRVVSF